MRHDFVGLPAELLVRQNRDIRNGTSRHDDVDLAGSFDDRQICSPDRDIHGGHLTDVAGSMTCAPNPGASALDEAAVPHHVKWNTMSAGDADFDRAAQWVRYLGRRCDSNPPTSLGEQEV